MNLGVKDRGVTIVTGGASGIGLAIAKALLGEGWKLIIADLAQGPLDAARAELEVLRADGHPDCHHGRRR
jgi:NAD(P)-dependent dehydrogenase (short-subunit alcohol dehydrogenase family)